MSTRHKLILAVFKGEVIGLVLALAAFWLLLLVSFLLPFAFSAMFVALPIGFIAVVLGTLYIECRLVYRAAPEGRESRTAAAVPVAAVPSMMLSNVIVTHVNSYVLSSILSFAVGFFVTLFFVFAFAGQLPSYGRRPELA